MYFFDWKNLFQHITFLAYIIIREDQLFQLSFSLIMLTKLEYQEVSKAIFKHFQCVLSFNIVEDKENLLIIISVNNIKIILKVIFLKPNICYKKMTRAQGEKLFDTQIKHKCNANLLLTLHHNIDRYSINANFESLD